MKKPLTALLLLGISIFSFGQCDENGLELRLVKASDTDMNIDVEAERHRVFYNPNCVAENKLVVNLVGTFGVLSKFMLFPSVAANNGYHVVSIKYKNKASEGIKCAGSSATNCYENYHIENLYGYDSLASITVDTNNCLLNRIEKLIQYLSVNYPNENWSQYLVGDELNWSKIIVAGHSQGGSHAFFMAHEFDVDRVLLFSSPFEYYNTQLMTAPWVGTPFSTPISKFYSFSNLYDEVSPFEKQFLAWKTAGMDASVDTLRVDNAVCNFENRKMLYTADSSTIGISNSAMHGSVYADELTFLDSTGNPVFEPVWKYMLGIPCVTTAISEVKGEENKIVIYPNPSNGAFFITTSKKFKKLEIVNVLGEICFTEKGTKSKNFISITNLKRGTYFVRISDANNFWVEKVMIK